MSSTKERNSNIEILRIIAMFLIVQSHFAVHGFMSTVDGDLSSVNNALNRFLITAITTGNIGNALFMIITGYFLSQSRTFKLQRFLKVAIQVLTYSLLIYLVSTIFFNQSSFSIGGILKAVTPLTHGTYWYFTSYILVYIFHPFLNTLIDNLNQRKLGILILLMMITWGFIPATFLLDFERSGFLVFCMFYFVGAYLRRYYTVNDGVIYGTKKLFANKSVNVSLVMAIMAWASLSIMTAYFTPFYRIVYMASPFVVIMAVALFVFFLNRTWIKKFGALNTIAGCMGGGYILCPTTRV